MPSQRYSEMQLHVTGRRAGGGLKVADARFQALFLECAESDDYDVVVRMMMVMMMVVMVMMMVMMVVVVAMIVMMVRTATMEMIYSCCPSSLPLPSLNLSLLYQLSSAKAIASFFSGGGGACLVTQYVAARSPAGQAPAAATIRVPAQVSSRHRQGRRNRTGGSQDCRP